MSKSVESIDVDGLDLSYVYDPSKIRQAMKYKPKKGEVIVASYPKCGTTWTMMIVLLLKLRGEPIKSAKEWFNCMTLLEAVIPEKIERMSKPRCIKTHLPFDRLTYSKDAKYIYITRHPADCIVSFYHYLHSFPYNVSLGNSFDKVFDLFLKGRMGYNDYFDHLLSWYEQRNLPNVLFLTYESTKKDHRGTIMKITKFLDDNLVNELIAEDESMLKKVLHHSSLESMKISINSFYDEALTTPPSEQGSEDFGVEIMNKIFMLMDSVAKKGFKRYNNVIRKGEIGEGNVTLSEDQKKRLNARILEKTAHSDVMDLWKDV